MNPAANGFQVIPKSCSQLAAARGNQETQCETEPFIKRLETNIKPEIALSKTCRPEHSIRKGEKGRDTQTTATEQAALGGAKAQPKLESRLMPRQRPWGKESEKANQVACRTGGPHCDCYHGRIFPDIFKRLCRPPRRQLGRFRRLSCGCHVLLAQACRLLHFRPVAPQVQGLSNGLRQLAFAIVRTTMAHLRDIWLCAEGVHQ